MLPVRGPEDDDRGGSYKKDPFIFLRDVPQTEFPQESADGGLTDVVIERKALGARMEAFDPDLSYGVDHLIFPDVFEEDGSDPAVGSTPGHTGDFYPLFISRYAVRILFLKYACHNLFERMF